MILKIKGKLNSLLRRGKSCFHLKYGLDVAVNAGSLLMFAQYLLLKELNETYKNKIFQIFIEEILNLHIGLAWDIEWHRGKVVPSEVNYIQMVAFKTGIIPKMISRMVATILNLNEDKTNLLVQFAQNLGISFQIQDDILNLSDSEHSKNKGQFCEDITEGKRSLIAIHALNKSSQKNRLLEILDSHSNDINIKKEALSIMKESKSLDYAKNIQKMYFNSAIESMSKVLLNNIYKESLKEFCMEVIK